MAKNVDIIDVMIAVHRGEMKASVSNGYFMLENTKSGERVRLNETDAAPVVHGRWVWTETGEEDYEQYWVCSKCGEHTYFITDYCADCGAKMDLEVNDA